MSTKQFIRRMIIRILVLIVISTVLINIINLPTLNNDIAIDQMENSDAAYENMYFWNNIKNGLLIGQIMFSGIVVSLCVYDTYKFIKNKNEVI